MPAGAPGARGQPPRFPAPLRRPPGALEWTAAFLSAPHVGGPAGKRKCSSKTTPWHHLELLEPTAPVRLSGGTDLDPLCFLLGRSQP